MVQSDSFGHGEVEASYAINLLINDLCLVPHDTMQTSLNQNYICSLNECICLGFTKVTAALRILFER